MTEPARSFQHYEVLRRDDGAPWELGRGAMGVTYKAFDVNLCCEVALKVVSRALVEHPEARERFVREARAAAALRHRNVASVYHLGNDGEHFFYAMEFINGETLDALVRRAGPLSMGDTLRVILQVARALAAAARQQLVHRDIKPANLMVTHEDADEETVVKVIDFGLARAAADADDSPPLTVGGFVGTPQFASPEQLEERPLDARSDLYSLGVTAWFLLTGRVPFSGSLATVCQQQLTQPPPWDGLPADLPACVLDLLGRLLEKDAARRPQTAVEVRAAVEACLDRVQGTIGRRNLHLPTLPAVAPGKDPAKPTGRGLQTGALLNGRYRLLREIGGTREAGVYQARDEANAERPVAVRILPKGRNDWEEDARLAQASAQENLVQILALERSLSPDARFLVEEWLTGFTLHDLLAARGGALTTPEALRLLEQAAAASDRAERCRLDHVDLSPARCFVNFPSLDGAAPPSDLASRSMADWPKWGFKTHALRPKADPLALDTWTGGDTLLPATANGSSPVSPFPGGSSEGRYVQALAKLAYQLFGGVPTNRQGPFPALNEEANSLLRHTISGAAVFASGWQWHEAFAGAIGGDPGRNVAPPRPAAKSPAAVGDGRRSIPDPPPAPFRQAAREADSAGPEETMAGSAWDRLTMVAEPRSHPGRWVAGLVGLTAVFVLGFAGILVWLWQQTPARAAALSTASTHVVPPKVSGGKRSTPRLLTPPPLAAGPVSTPVPRPAVLPTPAPTAQALAVFVPTPASTASAREENIPPAPTAAIEATPVVVPVPSPRDRWTMVRVDSLPEGAQIRVGNEVVGVTPCRVRLPHGEYQLIARLQGWPETRQTIQLDGGENRAAVKIRMMRPDLIPGGMSGPSPASDGHARRIIAPAARHPSGTETPVMAPSPPEATAEPTPGVSEPEVRPAQRVLTPFTLDGPDASSPPPQQPTPGARQPFPVDDR